LLTGGGVEVVVSATLECSQEKIQKKYPMQKVENRFANLQRLHRCALREKII
jgi:hypothetical protein